MNIVWIKVVVPSTMIGHCTMSFKTTAAWIALFSRMKTCYVLITAILACWSDS